MRFFRRSLIFLVCVIFSGFFIAFLLTPPSRFRILFKEYNEGDFKTIVLGQSHSESGINPYILSCEEDGNVINFTRPQILNPIFYYVLKEADKDGNIRKVYLEIDSAYWYRDIYEMKQGGVDCNMLPYISGRVELEYINDILLKQNYNNIFDYTLNKWNIKSIPKMIKVKTYKEYKDNNKVINALVGYPEEGKYQGRGFVKRTNIIDNGDCSSQFYKESIKESSICFFKKIVNYCKERKIELVCFTTALPPSRLLNENRDEEFYYFNNLCKNLNIPYYNFNYIKSDYMDYKEEDFYDNEGHMLWYLADKQSELLKEISHSKNPDKYFCTSYNDVLNKFK